MRRFAIVCLGVATAFALGNQLTAAEPDMKRAAAAVAYVDSIQNSDGGFPGFGPASSSGSSIDAVFALSAAGVDAKTITAGNNGPDDYLATAAATFSASSPGAAAKLVLALLAMDLDETNFASIDPYAVMQTNYNAISGAYGSDAFAQALYVLAVENAGAIAPPEAIDYLTSLQLPTGSWEFCCGFGGDTNTTALAMRALLNAGTSPANPVITNGLNFLMANQESDGGFPYLLGFGSEPNSTGFVLQALVAAGEDVEAGGPWDKGVGLTPQAWLIANQNASTGALRYFGTDDAFATYQGLPGLTLAAFPERADIDADGLLYAADNCPSVSNVGQQNADADFTDLSPPKLYDDATVPHSDRFGDVCDADNDNDGLDDTQEASGASCAGQLTDPNDGDSDGDNYRDGAECSVGTNPNVLASKPTQAQCGSTTDSDGDGLIAFREFCFYSTAPTVSDTDNDGCADGIEVASINGNRAVNVVDLQQVAGEFGAYTLPGSAVKVNFDFTKNGAINVADLSQIAALLGTCP